MNTYRIADITVGMDTFGRTLQQAEAYRTAEAKPELVVFSDAKALQEKYPHLSLDDCEYMSTCSCFYQRLAFFHGMMLHSSCVVVDGKAYLFSAPSGTGKSTHVQLWLKLFGDRAYVLNDDKPALRVIGDKIYVYGTPWSGKYDCSVNARAELGGIAFLKRAEENSMRPMGAVDAYYGLMDQTIRQCPPSAQLRFMDTVEKIASCNQIFELCCNMDPSAARLSYETMSGKRFTNED